MIHHQCPTFWRFGIVFKRKHFCDGYSQRALTNELKKFVHFFVELNGSYIKLFKRTIYCLSQKVLHYRKKKKLYQLKQLKIKSVFISNSSLKMLWFILYTFICIITKQWPLDSEFYFWPILGLKDRNENWHSKVKFTKSSKFY